MWLTSLVMVLVHDRVPDMKIYPPLPDIVLDNVPHIPLAFALCELLGALLALIWAFVLLFHRHRWVSSNIIYLFSFSEYIKRLKIENYLWLFCTYNYYLFLLQCTIVSRHIFSEWYFLEDSLHWLVLYFYCVVLRC